MERWVCIPLFQFPWRYPLEPDTPKTYMPSHPKEALATSHIIPFTPSVPQTPLYFWPTISTCIQLLFPILRLKVVAKLDEDNLWKSPPLREVDSKSNLILQEDDEVAKNHGTTLTVSQIQYLRSVVRLQGLTILERVLSQQSLET